MSFFSWLLGEPKKPSTQPRSMDIPADDDEEDPTIYDQEIEAPDSFLDSDLYMSEQEIIDELET